MNPAIPSVGAPGGVPISEFEFVTFSKAACIDESKISAKCTTELGVEGDCVSPCRSANATGRSEPQQVVDWLETGRIEDKPER